MNPLRVTLSSLAVLLLPLALLATGAAPAQAATYRLDRTISDTRITESSGLARSTWSSSVLWTHNDSGDLNRIFAIAADGTTKATYTLAGANANDWEDIASGPAHSLWVADTGDNDRVRSAVAIYKVTEPQTLATGTLAATKYVLTYPDGAHDAEGLMVHPVTGRVYLVSKQATGAAIYVAPATLSANTANLLTRVADAPAYVTAAAFAPNGVGFVLVDYWKAHIYAGLGAAPSSFAKPSLFQGESVEVSGDGQTIYLGSEGGNSPVYATAWPSTTSLNLTPGSSSTAATGTSFTDGQVATTFTLPRTTNLGGGVYAGALMRGAGSSTGYAARARFAADGSITLSVTRNVAGAAEAPLGSSAVLPTRFAAGSAIRVESSVSGTTAVTISVRAYAAGATVPAWQLTVTDSSASRLTTAAAPRVWGYLSSSAVGALALPYSGTTVTVVR
ncbi:MAG: hypothetical protein IPJ14_01815 [Kineosporiaceae bacterium]|nr:hypothetical protein [Kineosporiaceae bacterium]MBK7621424.1 hypothetical protein [Kineosporiaceae bacterium]MBK8077418.1 hypothetical protein [Kineosporiaceae bacterium]